MHSAQCVTTVGQYSRVPLGKSQVTVPPGVIRRVMNLGSRQGLAVSGRGVIVTLEPSGSQEVNACLPDGGISVITTTDRIDNVWIDTLTTGTTTPAFVWIVDLASLEAANKDLST
jgi:hypothetical protein